MREFYEGKVNEYIAKNIKTSLHPNEARDLIASIDKMRGKFTKLINDECQISVGPPAEGDTVYLCNV